MYSSQIEGYMNKGVESENNDRAVGSVGDECEQAKRECLEVMIIKESMVKCRKQK